MVAIPDPDIGGGRSGRRIRHILIVDDERHVVRLLQVNLERAGYRVSVAFNGKEALEQVSAAPPDLIVMEVLMPQMDGYEVLVTLRKQPETREIPVILLSKKASDADVFRGWAAGVDHFLSKPFNPYELLAFIARM
jgi:two-component system, OmpR family, alkaline phosphatase synthesis response regulator PhoP